MASAVYSVCFVVLPLITFLLLLEKHYETWSTVLSNIIVLMFAGLFLTVILANVISCCTWQSSHAENKDIKRNATITVAILSSIYCFCNAGGISIIVLYLHAPKTLYSIPHVLWLMSAYILLPLNSMCNPVVYLIRKEDMRYHVKALCGKGARFFFWRNRGNNADLELQV